MKLAIAAAAPLCRSLAHDLQRVVDLIAFENREDRTSEADQRAAGRPCCASLCQTTELQSGAAVVEQDAAVAIADHHRLRQFGHQRGQAVLLFLDRGLGGGDLGIDIVHQTIALLRQIIGRLGQQLDLRRPLRRHPEIAVRRQHQAQVLGHLEQTLDVLAEQVTDDQQTDDEAEGGHQCAE
jgi:hypothetical protein